MLTFFLLLLQRHTGRQQSRDRNTYCEDEGDVNKAKPDKQCIIKADFLFFIKPKFYIIERISFLRFLLVFLFLADIISV